MKSSGTDVEAEADIDLIENHLDIPLLSHGVDSDPSTLDHRRSTSSEMSGFRDGDDEDSVSRTSSTGDEIARALNDATMVEPNNHGHPSQGNEQNPRVDQPGYINPELYISTQFYTFNGESHSLMIRCIREGRLAVPHEIQIVTSETVLASWRSVWKDRNEDTAYITGWKRIQDKLNVHVDPQGNEFLCFKNNPKQFVSHFNQWQDIVMSFHGDADFKHLGLRETIDKIKQVWNVGAKFYGIPESFIRGCISVCPVCSDSSGSMRGKRKKFEYTESFELPAKEVPFRLQQLAAKYKVVLCIRQKYIRYRPFMAEVKDYACHRAGDPSSSKKSKTLKREPYASKRCGCVFRIRAILPIANYNEKEKSFIYQEDGVAVFKLFAVHSGHEPGPLDGHARIIHRASGYSEGILLDQDTIYGVSEEEIANMRSSYSQQIQELKNMVESLEGSVSKVPDSLLCFASRDLLEITNKLRTLGDYHSEKSFDLITDQDLDDIMIGEDDLPDWDDHPNGLIEGGDDSFSRTLEEVVAWEEMASGRDLEKSSCNPESWLNSEESKIQKPLRENGNAESDVGIDGMIQVENFYQENPKWYDSEADCGDSGLKHGGRTL